MNLKSKLPNLQENVLLANHTTFRIGGAAKYFFVAESREDFISAVRSANEEEAPFFILGGGSNLLVADEGFDGLVIKVKNLKLEVKSFGDKLKIICESGVPFGKIILESANQGYSGAEWGFGIPGTIGGAIFGNAGRLGQAISQVVKSVRVLDKNLNEKEILAAECEFGYRESRFKKTEEIILGATLVFKKKEKFLIEQVLSEAKEVVKHAPPYPSAGCAFKNYIVNENSKLLQNHPELTDRIRSGKLGVGYLIDRCGLKGRQIGGAKIWEGHANYIVNVGGAKAADVLSLIKLCKNGVKNKFEIDLDEEIRYLKKE